MEKIEVRHVGGPLDGTTGEYDYPLPLALRMTTARKPIHSGQMVTADQVEPGGAQYRLRDLLGGGHVYVVAGEAT